MPNTVPPTLKTAFMNARPPTASVVTFRDANG